LIELYIASNPTYKRTAEAAKAEAEVPVVEEAKDMVSCESIQHAFALMADLFLVKNAFNNKHAHVSKVELKSINDLIALFKNIRHPDTSSDFDKEFWADDAQNFAKAFAKLHAKSADHVNNCEENATFKQLHDCIEAQV